MREWPICGITLKEGEKLQTVLRIPVGGQPNGSSAGPLPEGVPDQANQTGQADRENQAADSGYAVPATLICGRKPGKTVLISAGIHSGEYPGIPAVIRAAKEIDPEEVSGNIVFLHCVNTSGFWGMSLAVVPEDGFNLNRDYPGKEDGTVGERIAAWFMKEFFPKVDFILDFHSGGAQEIMTPCLFFPSAPKVTEAALAAAKALNVPFLLASAATAGEYSYAANYFDVPGMIIERGYTLFCKEKWIEDDYKDIRLLLDHLGIYKAEAGTRDGQLKRRIFRKTIYLDAAETGLWYPAVRKDTDVKKGDLLGHTEDFFGHVLHEYRAEEDGHVIYYTAGLSVEKDSFLCAYGILDSEE